VWHPPCLRAIAVLTRQRALHRHLKFRGRLDHDPLLFTHDGAPESDSDIALIPAATVTVFADTRR
jgi:hypothetical protein